MDQNEVTQVVGEVRTLVEARYVYPDVAAQVAAVLASGLAEGRYPGDERRLADVVTADLQSVNGDKHLRLLYHDEPLSYREPGDDAEEYAAMARWAEQTCGGVASVRLLAGNVGYLDLQPVLFPAIIGGELLTAAMSLVAVTAALIIDVRGCLGGEPAMSAFIISYLWDHDPVQLTGLAERQHNQPRQFWTMPYVPGRRFGKAKPVYALTSRATFSGGEQLAYDLQQFRRAVIAGEPTRGGGHAREGFRVHPHLEATISVAAAVNPVSGTSWEGTGVTPDIQTPAGQALQAAHQLALEQIIAADGPQAAEARSALAGHLG
jgi:Peptidase family S41/N-terminal domain of Peptidase_S41 in eukaryotic IRBP